MSKPFLPLILVFSLFVSTYVQAQTSLGQDINTGWVYATQTLRAPLSNKISTAVTAGAIVLSTGIVYLRDEQILIGLSGRSSFSKELAIAGELLGNPWVHMGALGGNYLLAKCIKNPGYTDKSIRLLSAAALTGVSVQFIKILTSRARPYTGRRSNAFFSDYFSGPDHLSFPSGHTALAFSLASSLAHLYDDKVWLPLVVYPLAALTAWSRIHDLKHWPSDVVFGAALGYYIGKYMTNYGKVRLNLAPTPYGGMGLSASVSL
jgi:membrane-associated phospholipid phosphatase